MMVPLVLAVLLVVWALPSSHAAPTRLLYQFFLAFLVCLVMWPNYLAFSLPGLPWITLIRITGIPLALLLLISASSEGFRRELVEVLRSTPLVWKLFVAFLAIQLISIAFSARPLHSVQRFFVAQIYWTSIFFCSCYVFKTPGRVTRMAFLLGAMAVFVSLIGLWEWRIGHVPWANKIPSFLRIEDEAVLRILSGTTRTGTNIYRVQSTFSTPLGLAEYLALASPLLIHIVVASRKPVVRALSFGALAFIFLTIYNSNARLGAVGFFMSLLLYVGLTAIQRWNVNRNSIFAPAITIGYPLIITAFFLATLFVGRLRRMVWGGGEHSFSTEARSTQVEMGLPKIFKAPWGHGAGQSGEALGYTNPSGLLTVDSYYLTVALDYGVLGFFCFYGMLCAAVVYGLRGVFRAAHGEEAYLLPLSISLIVFLVIKSVFSQENGHAVVFILMGALCALVQRSREEQLPRLSQSRSSVAAAPGYP
jgi:hypothetical protein